MRRLSLLVFCFSVCFFLFPSAPAAHQTAMSTLKVEVRPETRQIDMLLSISGEDLSDHFKDYAGPESGTLEEWRAEYVSAKLGATNNGTSCAPSAEEFVELRRADPRLHFRKTVECTHRLGRVTLENTVMHGAVGGYTHMAQIQVGNDLYTTAFDTNFPTYTIDLGEGSGQTAAGGDDVRPPGGHTSADDTSFFSVFTRYVWQGILHIVLGIDHVLFVLCLLLAVVRFRQLLGVVTSFTVAHSITLGLSAVGAVTVAPSVVEPLIALSIAWIAVEVLLERDSGRWLYATTFAFGLLHGFGFSYVLRDEVGLPTDALLPALFSFNVGVEVGQIAILALAWPLLQWAREQDWERRAIRAASIGVLVVAAYWFVERIAAG